ncbi:E3 ubiquitin-protein ligase TRIM71 [Halotydeus destructor]|nr:E3 ubiquitin-protein ligase TRIM71 [Halotydeus destructor]
MSSTMSTSADDSILSLIHNLLLEEQANNRTQGDECNLIGFNSSPDFNQDNAYHSNSSQSKSGLEQANSTSEVYHYNLNNDNGRLESLFNWKEPSTHSSHQSLFAPLNCSKESSCLVSSASTPVTGRQLTGNKNYVSSSTPAQGNNIRVSSIAPASSLPPASMSSQSDLSQLINSLVYSNGLGATMTSPPLSSTSINNSYDPLASPFSSFARDLSCFSGNNMAAGPVGRGDERGPSTVKSNHLHQLQQQQLHHHRIGNNMSRPGFQQDKFESQVRVIANEIQSTIQQHMNGLQMRKEQLLQQLETIRNVYVDLFRNRSLMSSSSPVADMDIDEISSLPLPNITFTKPDLALHKAVSSMGFLTAPAFAPYCTASGEGLELAVPGLNTSFTIVTKNCFNDDLLIGREAVTVNMVAMTTSGAGESIPSPPGAGPSRQNDIGNNAGKLNQSSGGEGYVSPFNGPARSSSSCAGSVSGSNSNGATGPTRTVINHSLLDHNNGKYTVTYVVPVSRTAPDYVSISVSVNGIPISASPFRAAVKTQHRQSWKKILTFGGEGNSIGQFCRPWGVAMTRLPANLTKKRESDIGAKSETPAGSASSASSKSSKNNVATNPTSSTNEYLIAIADRSNNRIQVFKYDASLNQLSILNVFGSGPGTRQGQFDRPAGICFNMSLNHIIVADKDNHRVQVFDLTGRYLFKFGEKGNRAGQFCYPWDIDSCPLTHQVLVSDTRNRRVQLFTPYGQYIMHFAQPLDSPRGVGFLGEKKLVVADFNKHRLLIFDKYSRDDQSSSSSTSSMSSSPPNASTTRSIGFGEGSGWGEFLRPQGLSICGQFVFCADSRNNRICMYNMNTQVFEYMSEELALDRPSGIAVADDLLAVIDFGNNRLHICRR